MPHRLDGREGDLRHRVETEPPDHHLGVARSFSGVSMISPSPIKPSSSVSWRRVAARETLARSLSAEMGGTYGVLRRWKAEAIGSPGSGLDQSAGRADLVNGGGSVLSDPRCPTPLTGAATSTVPPETPSFDSETPSAATDLCASGAAGMVRNGGGYVRITRQDHRNTQRAPPPGSHWRNPRVSYDSWLRPRGSPAWPCEMSGEGESTSSPLEERWASTAGGCTN